MSNLKEKFSGAGSKLSSAASAGVSSFVLRVEEKVTKKSEATRASQLFAACLLPVVTPVYMGVSAAVYLAMTQVLFSIGLNGVALTGIINFIIGLGLVIAGFVLLFKWVSTGGFGYFEV